MERTAHRGWLDARHEYPTGAVPEAFVTALGRLRAFETVDPMRGLHPCRLGECAGRDVWPPIMVIIDGLSILRSTQAKSDHSLLATLNCTSDGPFECGSRL